jgi:hypothetical protein
VAWPDHRPKPALAALGFVSRLFRRAHQTLPVRIAGNSTGVPVQSQGFAFSDGEAVLVAWIPTRLPDDATEIPGGAAQAATPLPPDPRATDLGLELSCAAATLGEANLYDAEGQGQGTAALRRAEAPATGWLMGPVHVTAGSVVIARIPGCRAR